jgi:hypothetical protein
LPSFFLLVAPIIGSLILLAGGDIYPDTGGWKAALNRFAILFEDRMPVR